MSAQRPALAYELLREPPCVVLYKAARPTTDRDWEPYLELVRAALPYGNGLRFVAWNEDGEIPRATQARMTDMLRGYTHQVAVISSSVVMRFIVSIFLLWNRNIRFFSPSQKEEIYVHLGCDAAAREAIAACLERLRRQVDQPEDADAASRL